LKVRTPPVLHVLIGPGGGAWEVLQSLAARQRRQRFVAIGISYSSTQPVHALRERGQQNADYWLEHVFPGRIPFGSAISLPPVAAWRAKVLEETGADPIVHFHNGVACGLFVLPGRPGLKAAAIVVTFHGLVPGDEIGGTGCFGWRRFLHGALARRVASGDITCVAVSRTSAERIAARYGIPRARGFRIVLNGVNDPPTMDPAFQRSEKFVCCFVGQLSKHKNWAAAAGAVRELRARGVRVELVVAGDGCDRRKVEALRDDGFVFLGPIDQAASRVIAHSDVLILPSLSEGLPLVALEALAVGVPVVLTKQAGGEEIIHGPVVGRSVQAVDDSAFAEAIHDTLQLHGPAQQSACRTAYMAKFTAERMYREYESLYEEACGQ
jgi:glycosyltransferase involved in cell wall biosynthesis